MKKLLLTSMIAVAAFSAGAQNYDKVKTMLKANKFEEAKAEVDKIAENEKYAKTPDAWYYKAKVYAAIADNEAESAKVPGARVTAFDALKKYVDMDTKQHINLQLDQFQPLMSIYQGFFKTGAANFNSKDYEKSYTDFLNAGEVSNLMLKKGWSNVPLDTTVILYTAVSAQNAKKDAEAAKYYTILAQAKVNGSGMEDCYKWLSDYYSKNEKIDSAQKYLAMGREIFPKDPWWTSMELDMLREKGEKPALFAKYEEAIKEAPDKLEFSYNYALELYEYAYNADPAKRPADSEELISKVETNLNKALTIQPDHHSALLVLGQVKYNKGVDIQNLAAAIKGTKPEDVKKRGELKTEAIKKYDESIPYLEKIVTKFDSAGKLKMEERQALKSALDILVIVYDQKGAKDKMKVYEEKYNNVDKVH